MTITYLEALYAFGNFDVLFPQLPTSIAKTCNDKEFYVAECLSALHNWFFGQKNIE